MGWFSKKEEKAFEGTSFAAPRCYESHPKVKIGKGTLYGGSSSYPVRKADIYVALQSGSTCGATSDPWDEQKVVEIHYGMRDMHAPSNVERFKKMIDWLCNQLHDGKTVHVGCVGGHGRTGTVITAIVAQALGKKDAIQWTRAHYCKKAVESKEQVKFLMEHYGVQKAEPTKSYSSVSRSSSYEKYESGSTPWKGSASQQSLPMKPRLVKNPDDEPPVRRIVPSNVTGSTKSFQPMKSSRCIWKQKGA